jgi:hypothetical protein
MKNIVKHIAEVLEEHRLDEYVQHLVNLVSWDDLMLTFSNICIFTANKKDSKRKNKEYKKWFKLGLMFHEAIIDSKTASVQKRKLKKLTPEIDSDDEPCSNEETTS